MQTNLDRKRFRFVLATIALLLVANAIAAIYALGWISVTVNTAVILALYVGFAVRHSDRVMTGWLVFGLAAGVAELVADAYLVSGTGSLVYVSGAPRIWDSPFYMPFSWTMVLVQLLAIGHWLASRMSLPTASVLTGLFGGLNIPVYEHMARHAEWWYYRATPTLGGAPYYVILAEMLLALPLAWAAVRLARHAGDGLGRPVLLGIAEGAVMLFACIVAWWLLGPCEGAVIQLSCGT